MNRWTIPAGLVLCGLLATSLLLHGRAADGADKAEKKEKRTINTSGTATVKIAPDAARMAFGVQTFAATVKRAREMNAESVKKIMAAIDGLKIPGLRAKTTTLTVNPVYQHRPNEEQPPEPRGYQIIHWLSVLIKDADRDKLSLTAARVLDTTIEHGANLVQQVSFFKEDDSAAKREAAQKAVRDALSNAQALAAGAQVNIGETIQITGQPQFHYPSPMYTNAVQSDFFGRAGGGETQLVAGDLEVTCTVNVTCTY